MTNGPNRWVKKRIPKIKKLLFKGRCGTRNCKEKRLSKLEFVHIKQTPISRTGPRDRKTKIADVVAHPKAYRLKYKKHHLSSPAAQKHDKKMRKLGAKKK